jgi:4-oxalomesaconate tautomerase
MTMVSPPKPGSSIATRTFIPHRCHAAIGVLKVLRSALLLSIVFGTVPIYT